MALSILTVALTVCQLTAFSGFNNHLLESGAFYSYSTAQNPPGKTAPRTPSRARPKAEASKNEVLTNDSIIQLLRAGIEEDLIIAKIQQTEHDFDTSTAGLIALKDAGASGRLIQFMMDPSKPVAVKSPEPADTRISPPKTVPPIANPERLQAAGSKPSAESPAVPAAVKPSGHGEFKDLLRKRYGDKVVVLMIEGMFAGETGKGWLSGAGDTKLQYHHYHPSLGIPSKQRSHPWKLLGKRTNEMSQVDERTFGVLETLQLVPLRRGDQLKIDRMHILSERIEFNLITTSFQNLQQIDINKASSETTTTVRPGQVSQRVVIPNLGFRFKFYFDKETLKSGNYEMVIAEINKYLLPQEEATPFLEAEKHVKIDQGMTEDEVISHLGQPMRVVTFGTTKTLIYRDVKVVLKDGKVAELKVD